MSQSISTFSSKPTRNITDNAQSSLAFMEEFFRNEFGNIGGQVNTIYENLTMLAQIDGMSAIRYPRLILELREKARLVLSDPNPTAASDLRALQQPCKDSRPLYRIVPELRQHSWVFAIRLCETLFKLCPDFLDEMRLILIRRFRTKGFVRIPIMLKLPCPIHDGDG